MWKLVNYGNETVAAQQAPEACPTSTPNRKRVYQFSQTFQFIGEPETIPDPEPEQPSPTFTTLSNQEAAMETLKEQVSNLYREFAEAFGHNGADVLIAYQLARLNELVERLLQKK